MPNPKTRRIIVELRHNKKLAAVALAAKDSANSRTDPAVLPKLPHVRYDTEFHPLRMPALKAWVPGDHRVMRSGLPELDSGPESGTYLIRGEVDEAHIDTLQKAAAKDPAVAGVFSDLRVAPFVTCVSSPPVGTAANVEGLVGVPAMRRCGMDGAGVLVAVVDTGFNVNYLNQHGKTPAFDASLSWAYRPGLTPGANAAVTGSLFAHGNMVAYDVCIAAPRCTLLDIIIFSPMGRELGATFFTDVIRAYEHLVSIMSGSIRPPSLVVNNSWGTYDPTQDFPYTNPGHYISNPNHPLNRIISTLDALGADIVFAAGNCGTDCPGEEQCEPLLPNQLPPKPWPVGNIYGANSHPGVLCVAGVDTNRNRVGYSAVGHGTLADPPTKDPMKPDVSGYTHFSGSGVYPADSGTSAACPVVAGVIAGVRCKLPLSPFNPGTWPASIRSLVKSSATDRGGQGWDSEYGFGIVNGGALARKFCPSPIRFDICRIIPEVCETRTPWPRGIRIPDPRHFPEPVTELDSALRPADAQADVMRTVETEADYPDGDTLMALAAFYAGYHRAQVEKPSAAAPGKCGCGGSH